MGTKRRGVARRALAACVLVAVAACSAAGTEPADERPEPITIGFLGELTGPFAIWGIPARNGMRLAVADVNERGGVLGRELRLVERDTQGSPDEAVTAMRGLIERSGVVALGGVISSDVALAVSRIAEEERVPLFLVKAGSDQILHADSRYTFRTCLPAAPMNLDPIVEFIDDQGITRVGAVIADYAWGRAIEDALEERFAAMPEVRLEVAVAPVGESDFTPYLRGFADLDPQLLIATGHPPGALPLTRQAADLGMDAYVTGSNSPSAAVMEAVGDAAYDRYVDFTCADVDDPDFQQLAARYHDRFDAFMEDDAVAGYGQVLMVVDALSAIGQPNPADIAEHLRDNMFVLPGYAWDLGWTEWGELRDAQPLLTILRRQQPPEGVHPGADWYPEVLLRADPLDPYVP